MKMNLYSINDASNVINKELGEAVEIDIYLKRDVDISAPTIILAGNDYNKYNYCSIPDLNRFYFINNISNVGGTRWQLELVCDVLETYKDDILSSNARFYRNIKTGDYLNANIDNSIRATIVTYNSDKGLPEGEALILTTIGEGS